VADDAQSLALDVMARIRTEAPKWIMARTVSILVEDENRALTQLGTGVLLAIADEVFVVSAAHVLSDARYYPLWINPVAAGSRMIPLVREVATTNDRHRVDFGFFRVPDEYVAELSAAKTCVRLKDVSPEIPAAHWYATLGFPLELNVFHSTDTVVPTQPIYYATRRHDTAADPIDGFDPVINVALELPLANIGDAATRKPSALPDLHGMSGAGIWQLLDLRERAMTWSVDRIRLAGIFHTRAGDGLFQTESGEAAIVGVHFAHVVTTIRTAFPRLASAIDVVFPSKP
jgi:hypothetical protein